MAHFCKNCDTNFEGKFCHNCGQKAFSEEDKTIKSIFAELVQFFTSFESTLLYTLKTILTAPGTLTLDYSNGIRKKYYKPLSLYLLIVIIYLLFPIAKGLNMEMVHYKTNAIGRKIIPEQIDNKLIEKNISFDELSAQFAKKSENTSKILLFLLIPLTTLLLFAIFPNRKYKIYDVSILSVELNAFFIAVIFLILPVLISLFAHAFQIDFIYDEVLFPFLIGLMGIYIFMLLRKFYQQKWPVMILKSTLATFLYLIMFQTIYKFLVFEITMLLL